MAPTQIFFIWKQVRGQRGVNPASLTTHLFYIPIILYIYKEDYLPMNQKANTFLEEQPYRQLNEEIRSTLCDFSAGGGALQHRRPAFYCQCQLSRFLRQRC